MKFDATYLFDYLESSEHAGSDRNALVCIATGERLDYATLRQRARAVAVTLREHGVAEGERVITFLPNCADTVVAFWGILMSGAVAVPVNPATKVDKLAFIVRDCAAVAVISGRGVEATMAQAAEGSRLKLAIVCGDVPASYPAPVVPMASLATREIDRAPPRSIIDQDLAAIIYTSGSTGEPKGVMLSHLNMVSASRSISTYLELRGDDIIYCSIPLAFDYGLYQPIMAARVGASVVVDRNFSFPVKAVEIMIREKATYFPGVPTTFAMMLANSAATRMRPETIRAITNTAAALPERHVREIASLFPGARLYLMYGLTECKRVSYLPPQQVATRPTSIGRGMPNEEVWLIGEDGRRLPNGSTGQLVIRGSNIMRGYWGRPRETAACIRRSDRVGDLQLLSGDVFRTDDEGYLFFAGRRDDIIKSRGEKVSPREIEDVIAKIAEVAEVAVIGVPDATLGAAIKAFVVLRPGQQSSAKQIILHCRQFLEAYSVPQYVELADSLPRTDNGKVNKKLLSQMVEYESASR